MREHSPLQTIQGQLGQGCRQRLLLHGVQGAGNHSSLLLLHLGVLFLDSVCLAFVEGLSGAQPFPFLNSRDIWAISRFCQWLEQGQCMFSLSLVLKEASMNCPDPERAAECLTEQSFYYSLDINIRTYLFSWEKGNLSLASPINFFRPAPAGFITGRRCQQ